MNKFKENVKDFYNKHQKDINAVLRGILIGGTCALSYMAGSKCTEYQIALGIRRACDRNPQLGTDLMNAMKEIAENDAKLLK